MLLYISVGKICKIRFNEAMNSKWLLAFCCIISVHLAASHLIACTGIRLNAVDGSSVNGRTLEFGVPIDVYMTVIPRGAVFGTYKAKYAAVGASCFDSPVLMDGMNEKGLVAAAFYFPGFAGYAQNKTDKALSPIEFPHWILTQFASLDEVKNALSSVVIAPIVANGWGSTPPPMHYVVYDRSGRSIVIEPINGHLIVHDNELGVITNSPTFDWHMTHLRSFINLTPFNALPLQLQSLQLLPFGQGSGLVGLPGDFTPPSRFVRAAFFSSAAILSKTSDEAVFQAFHILNQFDIPKGVAREKTKTDFVSDYTMMTCVKDPQTLKYYYRSYEDQTIRFVSLNAFDLNAKEIKKYRAVGSQTAVDSSLLLK